MNDGVDEKATFSNQTGEGVDRERDRVINAEVQDEEQNRIVHADSSFSVRNTAEVLHNDGGPTVNTVLRANLSRHDRVGVTNARRSALVRRQWKRALMSKFFGGGSKGEDEIFIPHVSYISVEEWPSRGGRRGHGRKRVAKEGHTDLKSSRANCCSE